MNMIHVAGLLGTLVMANAAMAHGGGLNAEGCHTNRKTGDYHCHRGSSRPAPQATAQSLSGDASGTVHYRDCAEARAAGAAWLPARTFGDSSRRIRLAHSNAAS